MERLSGRVSHCGVCHRTFGSLTGFDAHRKDGSCRVPKGYAEDGRGYWVLPDPRYAALRPTTAELAGSDPEFTGEMSTDEYIADVRGDEHAPDGGAMIA